MSSLLKNKISNDLQSDVCEINISPMIDMVFILLIFFIVTTVFVEEPGVEVARPTAYSAQPLLKNSILFAITNAEQVVYGGHEISVNRVRSIVKRITQKESTPVILQVDHAANSGLVVQVIDEAKLGGANTISISADVDY